MDDKAFRALQSMRPVENGPDEVTSQRVLNRVLANPDGAEGGLVPQVAEPRPRWPIWAGAAAVVLVAVFVVSQLLPSGNQITAAPTMSPEPSPLETTAPTMDATPAPTTDPTPSPAPIEYPECETKYQFEVDSDTGEQTVTTIPPTPGVNCGPNPAITEEHPVTEASRIIRDLAEKAAQTEEVGEGQFAQVRFYDKKCSDPDDWETCKAIAGGARWTQRDGWQWAAIDDEPDDTTVSYYIFEPSVSVLASDKDIPATVEGMEYFIGNGDGNLMSGLYEMFALGENPAAHRSAALLWLAKYLEAYPDRYEVEVNPAESENPAIKVSDQEDHSLYFSPDGTHLIAHGYLDPADDRTHLSYYFSFKIIDSPQPSIFRILGTEKKAKTVKR